ncbi:squalene--hopene cyclase [Metabacillus idriensis]|uniref:squalene--hopene cyclase n=1 Tax=Metabacillus idriensis TaxID=324768 RepID=UPI003D2C5ED7
MISINELNKQIKSMTDELRQLQQNDGSFRFCFEGGPMTDAFMIILLRSLQDNDEVLIKKLANRLLNLQSDEGTWKLYEDEKEGNLTGTVQAYTALLSTGLYKKSDPLLNRAESFIVSQGGLANVHFMTKWFLAVNGLYPWPKFFRFPLAYLLLPAKSPISMYQLSSYARIHFMPMILAMNKRYVHRTNPSINLSHLYVSKPRSIDWLSFTDSHRTKQIFIETLRSFAGFPAYVHRTGENAAEKYMLQRIEADGTLYSYASATFFMIYALLSLGYKENSTQIKQAVAGLKSIIYQDDNLTTLENSTSTVWDTALLSYCLQKAGIPSHDSMILNASSYLLSRQHVKKADWRIHNPSASPGGWGFSNINTNHPDNDDTAAVLRALTQLSALDPVYFEAWNKGSSWLLSMQNRDGGFGAFEKNVNNPIFASIPLENAKDAAIDPSTADLTGRVLEYFGNFAGLTKEHPSIQAAVAWLLHQQEQNGSWYGRWGVCYIYGTWAAITGLKAAGLSNSHPAINKAVNWLLSIQKEDGGFGESCRSSEVKTYMPLAFSTPSQTAWALDALLCVMDKKDEAIQKAVKRLMQPFDEKSSAYPTGIGLPKQFYIHYHSYNKIFPLLALSHYRNLH